MDISDKLIDYISPVKSPFEEEDVTQEELEFDGYMKFFRDSILTGIGSRSSKVNILSYWDEFKESCDNDQFNQFLDNCINKIIKKYKMQYLSEIINSQTIISIDSDKKSNFIKFIETDAWVEYFSKALDPIDAKLVNNQAKLKIFIDSDYDNFVQKIELQKTCDPIMRSYFMFCDSNEGRNTLFNIIVKDVPSIVVNQITFQKR